MLNFTVNGNEYKLEYSFEAAEHKETVQKMFDVLSGAHILRQATKKKSVANAMMDGTAEMVADIPHIVKTAFYSGLLENNPMTEKEAHKLMKAYMKENKYSYKKLFDDIKTCMEDDGFFDLSGLTEMLNEMGKNIEKNLAENPEK